MADVSFLDWPFFESRHKAWAAEVEAFASAHAERLADEHDADGSTIALVRAMGEAGLLRAACPEDGRLDVRSLCLARDILARHAGLADFAFAMQGLGTGPVTLFGTKAQRDEVLPAARAGTALAAFALSEPEAGSDVAALATVAERDGNSHYRITGRKTWISNGGIAATYIVFARTGEAPGAKGLSAFLVHADTPGFAIESRIDVTAPHPLATLAFDAMRVPAENLIGRPGEGFKVAMGTLDVFRATVGAAALGFARRALDMTVERATGRKLFGATLFDQQMSQAAIADSATEVEASALLVYRAAWLKDQGTPRVTREASMAKLHATEAAQRAADRCVQIHGGLGVTRGHKAEELYREVRALRVYEGASEIQRVVIARAERERRTPTLSRETEMDGMMTGTLAPSAHLDSFARDNLPPRELWPVFRLERPEFQYPARLNCAVELLDRNIERGRGDHPAIVTPAETLTYRQLAERVNRIANVLVQRLGFVPGNRVLLRSANNAWMIAAYFAVLKAGGVVVATMPLLRAKELGQMLRKARISHALCDARLVEELRKAEAPDLAHLVTWGNGELEAMCASASPDFAACDTAADDVCLIGFTSGSTGEPKGTMHFHRDMLAICDGYSAQVLRPEPTDVFIGSPPLAFTFGLGGLVLFPFRVGATAVLLEKAPPEELPARIAEYRATVCFTAPTAWRVMAGLAGQHDMSCLRKCVSAGETLPKPVFEAWEKATGLKLMDGIGATEMLHIFIAAREDQIRPGATGLPVPGYVARVVDEAGAEVPRGTPGRLAVQGPTGCRYLADPRQATYVQDGWNITGDTYVQDEDGYFWYQARNDDMIISAGYNIAGPEVEVALLTHPAVKECGVVGAPDGDRGMVVRAYVVLHPGHLPDERLAKDLQDHVKREIAPYKYPRSVVFVDALPRTETGKLQRFALRRRAQEAAA